MTKLDKMVADYVNDNYYSKNSAEKEDIAKAYKQGLIDMLAYVQSDIASIIKRFRPNTSVCVMTY